MRVAGLVYPYMKVGSGVHTIAAQRLFQMKILSTVSKDMFIWHSECLRGRERFFLLVFFLLPLSAAVCRGVVGSH